MILCYNYKALYWASIFNHFLSTRGNNKPLTKLFR